MQYYDPDEHEFLALNQQPDDAQKALPQTDGAPSQV